MGSSRYSDGKVASEYEKYRLKMFSLNRIEMEGLSIALSKVINRERINDSESRLYVFSQNGDIITTL